MTAQHRRSLLRWWKSARLLGAALVSLSLGHTAQALAEEVDASIFSLKGFGTVGMVHSSESKADFMATDLQRNGAGYSRKWSADVDSRLGAQLMAQFSPQLSGVVQATSEQRYDGRYSPEIEWANLKYEITPDLSARAGRIVLPTFLLSESRKVGYASPWVRPPVEVYGLVPLTRSDGLDVSARQRIGEVSNVAQFSYGKSSAKIPADGKVTSSGGEVNGKNAWAISDTLEYGAASFHISYLKADLSISSYKRLFDAYRQFGALGITQANAIAEKFDPDNKPFYFFGIGASYDPGKWFVMGEWGAIDTHSVYGKRSAWYVSSGYRIEKFTPYISFAQASLQSASSDAGLPLAYVPAAYRPTAAYLNQSLNEQLSAAPVQKTITLGVRWDFAKSAALKMQYDRSKVGAGSPGTLDNLQPGFVPGGKFNVFSATIDFVF